MRLSAHGAALIAEFEGFSARPYRDSGGVWTIGYGSTQDVGPLTKPVTREQALRRMMLEVDSTYGHAVNALRVPLTQNQFDALTSFAYNVGPAPIGRASTIGSLLLKRRYGAAADAMLAWNKAGGRVLPGLVRRRRVEHALFLEEPKDPLAGYPEEERALIRAYDRLRDATDPEGLERRRELRSRMEAKRQVIWRLAQPRRAGGDGKGWTHALRRRRYNSLLARSG